MLFLAFTIALPMEAVTKPVLHKNSQKSKFTQVKKFIRKHQAVFATIGAAGVLALVWYLVPEGKRQKSLPVAPPRINPTANYPVRERIAVVGASECDVREVVLQPGVQAGNWEHRLVDGHNGRYAWQHPATGEQLFAIQDGVGQDIREYVTQNGQHRYWPNEVGLLNRLVNRIAVRFGLDQPVVIRQLPVARQDDNTCAYHAYKNCQLILNELEDPRGDLADQLNDPNAAENFIDGWRDYILRNHPNLCGVHNGNRAGEWLHPQGVQHLVNLEHDQNRVTIVDSGRFQERLAQNPLAVQPPFDLPNQHQNRDFVHGFVIQDRDHWLTAVLRRVGGRIEWLIADSNNLPAFNRAGLMHLMASIHGRVV